MPGGLHVGDLDEWLDMDPRMHRRVIASHDMTTEHLCDHLHAARVAAFYTCWQFTLDVSLLIYHNSGPNTVYVALKIPVSEESMSLFPVFQEQAHVTISYDLVMDFEAPNAWEHYWTTKARLINALGPRRIMSMICGRPTGNERGNSFPIHTACELHAVIMLLREVIHGAGTELTDMHAHEFHISWLTMRLV